MTALPSFLVALEGAGIGHRGTQFRPISRLQLGKKAQLGKKEWRFELSTTSSPPLRRAHDPHVAGASAHRSARLMALLGGKLLFELVEAAAGAGHLADGDRAGSSAGSFVEWPSGTRFFACGRRRRSSCDRSAAKERRLRCRSRRVCWLPLLALQRWIFGSGLNGIFACADMNVSVSVVPGPSMDAIACV